jgi:2-keto-3-deoxy-L-rhamnonate aldolase RhmA
MSRSTPEYNINIQTNNILSKMDEGEVAYGCQFNSPSSEQIELLGIAGFDFVIFDGEHGSFTLGDLEDQSRVAQMSGLTAIGMVPDVEAPTIHSFLERGILGIHGPNITTPEDAQKLADACRYAPNGRRSLSFSRATHFGFGPPRPEYMAHANTQIIVIALLEHVDALDNLDAILSVEGIDLYAVGPKDLAQSMGIPGQMDHPRVKEFEAKVIESVHNAGKTMASEVISAQRASQLFLDAAVTFVNSHQPPII